MEDTQVPIDDLTRTDGGPTTRANPDIRKEPVPLRTVAGAGHDAGTGESAAPGGLWQAFVLAVPLGLVSSMAFAVLGHWLHASVTGTLAGSVVVFAVVFVTGALMPGLVGSRRS